MSRLQTIELEGPTGIGLRLEIHTEDLPLEGNVLASGNEEMDAEAEQEIRDEWDHNDFCWCSFRVVAELKSAPGICADAWLGGVSILEKYLEEGQTLEEAAKELAGENGHGLIGETLEAFWAALESTMSSVSLYLADEVSQGFSDGNYTNAYETHDLEVALKAIDPCSPEYRHAFVLGFFASYELHEIPGDAVELFAESYGSRGGQMAIDAGYTERKRHF